MQIPSWNGKPGKPYLKSTMLEGTYILDGGTLLQFTGQFWMVASALHALTCQTLAAHHASISLLYTSSKEPVRAQKRLRQWLVPAGKKLKIKLRKRRSHSTQSWTMPTSFQLCQPSMIWIIIVPMLLHKYVARLPWVPQSIWLIKTNCK